MSGISHLQKDQRTRPSRIDSLDADGVNSIIGRITGQNPSPVTESSAGAEAAQHSQVGAPPSPIMQNFTPQQYGGSDLQQMQQRMQMLEQKVAMHETGDTEEADKKVRRAKEVQSNRSGTGDSSGGTFAPNMNTPAAAKKIIAKDKADGEPDGAKAQQPGGQPMAAHTNILGISMNEWNGLIGVTSPYANPVEAQKNLSEAREGEEFEEFVEGYFTEDELAEAWFGFISDKGYDPDEFADFAESAEEYGDEVALLAIQDLEDEFQEAVDAFIEDSESEDDDLLTQEEVDFMMELWLEDRGLSTEMFHFMIDEAIATEDQDELDNLLAVEDLFYEYLDDVLAETSTWEVKKKLRGTGEYTPSTLGAPASKSFLAKTRKQGALQSKDDTKPKQGIKVNEAAEDSLPPMHPKSGGKSKRFGGLASEFPAAKGGGKKKSGKAIQAKAGKGTMPRSFHPRSTMTSATEATAAEFQKELGGGQSILTGKDSSPKASRGGPQVPTSLLRKKGAEPAPAAKPSGIKARLRAAFSKKKVEGRAGFPAWHIMKESDSIRFECDSDAGGGPSIDWERLTKSYDKKQRKGKR